jgi:hypothetical protein
MNADFWRATRAARSLHSEPAAQRTNQWVEMTGDLMLPSNTVASASNEQLFRNRNRSVARAFYRQLRAEGFTHEQVIELSTTLLDFVTEDLKERVQPAK